MAGDQRQGQDDGQGQDRDQEQEQEHEQDRDARSKDETVASAVSRHLRRRRTSAGTWTSAQPVPSSRPRSRPRRGRRPGRRRRRSGAEKDRRFGETGSPSVSEEPHGPSGGGGGLALQQKVIVSSRCLVGRGDRDCAVRFEAEGVAGDPAACRQRRTDSGSTLKPCRPRTNATDRAAGSCPSTESLCLESLARRARRTRIRRAVRGRAPRGQREVCRGAPSGVRGSGA